MASKLRTDFQPGEVFHADYINRANAQTNANTQDLNEVKDNIAVTAENAEKATQAAVDTAGYVSNLKDAIAELPDGQAVSEEVAEHTVQIAGLDDATTLGENSEGNTVKPSDVQSVYNTREFVEIKTDNNGNVLWSIGKDGNLEMNLPMTFNSSTHGVKDDRLDGYYTMASKEWRQLVIDAEDNIVFGIKTNGEVVASTMDANLAATTIKAVEDNIKNEYDEAINDLKAEASDPLDKYVSLASGISDDDIRNGTSKYDEIAKKSSNKNMTKQACSVLYNLMKLEKDNKFLATFFLNIDYRNSFHEYDKEYDPEHGGYIINGYDYDYYIEQFRTKTSSSGVNTYTPKEPKVHSDPEDSTSPLINNPTFIFDPLIKHAYYQVGSKSANNFSEHVINTGVTKTPLMYIFDIRSFTDSRGYGTDDRAEARAVLLTLIKKAWVDYKAIPVLCWHESNPYAPKERTSQDGAYWFSGSGYNYTYDDNGYPLPDSYPYTITGGGYEIKDETQSHRYVIKEILDKTEYGTADGNYPSINNTICGFEKGDNAREHTYASPWRWFDAKCQEVGLFIKEINAFINNMSLTYWDNGTEGPEHPEEMTEEEIAAWWEDWDESDEKAAWLETRKDLELPIIFRLWHECEDAWAWWGSSMCTPDEYKRFFKLTKENILTYSGSNSILFGYCTDHNFKTPLVKKGTSYDLRYPGDSEVDIVGFDDYSMGKPNYLQEGISKMKLVSSFAKAHGKPAFIWETGNTAVDEDWYNTWVSVFQTAGVNFSALMGWASSYPPYNITIPVNPEDPTYNQKMKLLNDQISDMAQYYNRSNMPCAEEGFDLTMITE